MKLSGWQVEGLAIAPTKPGLPLFGNGDDYLEFIKAAKILEFAKKKPEGFTSREIERMYPGVVRDCHALVKLGKLKFIDTGKPGLHGRPPTFGLSECP